MIINTTKKWERTQESLKTSWNHDFFACNNSILSYHHETKAAENENHIIINVYCFLPKEIGEWF